MIQRKQTLFLLELVFLGLALLFVPSNIIVLKDDSVNIFLLPLENPYVASPWLLVAMVLNFLGLALSLITVFLYKRRALQVKLCYTIMVIWSLITLITAFCPLVLQTGLVEEVQNNYFGVIAGVFAIAAAFLAARFINKDIDLLRSADRIR